ncbi:MAG: hypothetical protein Q9183_005668 [Haloplaca sp. 2 TL-2023]
MAHAASVSTIASGAGALATACENIAKGLRDLAERYRDANALLSIIARDLYTTQCAWQIVHHLTDGWRLQGRSSQDLLLRLDQSVAWGRLILAALDDDMSSCFIRLATPGEGLRTWFRRSRVAWSDGSLKRHHGRIRSQIMSMDLLISVLNRRTIPSQSPGSRPSNTLLARE